MTESHDLTVRLRAWSYRRQGLGRAAAEPEEALRDVVAVYSSHPTAPLALLCRCQALDANGFADLERRRAVVRLPAMRQSVFLLPTVTAPRIVAATRQPMERRAGALRYAGLDWDAYTRLKPRVLEIAREPVTAADLRAALERGDPALGEARLMTAVRTMTFEGLVLRLGTSLRADSPRYVAADAWLGQPLVEADPEESLRWLAEAYLRGYGPARVEDFAWWSGVSRGRARAAFAGSGLVDVGGGLMLPADQEAAFSRVEPLDAEAIDLLPKWDAYTMGYAPDGRQRLVDDAHFGRAYSTAKTGGAGGTSGDGLPLVLRGGRAVASWSHRFQGDQMLVTVAPFPAETLASAACEGACAEVGRLLGASAVAVTMAVG
jgi:hypothetical protein